MPPLASSVSLFNGWASASSVSSKVPSICGGKAPLALMFNFFFISNWAVYFCFYFFEYRNHVRERGGVDWWYEQVVGINGFLVFDHFLHHHPHHRIARLWLRHQQVPFWRLRRLCRTTWREAAGGQSKRRWWLCKTEMAGKALTWCMFDRLVLGSRPDDWEYWLWLAIKSEINTQTWWRKQPWKWQSWLQLDVCSLYGGISNFFLIEKLVFNENDPSLHTWSFWPVRGTRRICRGTTWQLRQHVWN